VVDIGFKLGDSINDFRNGLSHDVLAVVDEGYDGGIWIGFHCLNMTMVQKKAGLVQAMKLDHSFSSGMTSTDKSDLSSGFLWCALYILLMAVTREVLDFLPGAQPWLLAAPQIIAATVCLRAFRAAGQPLLRAGRSSESLAVRGALIVLAAAGLCGLQSFLSPLHPAANPGAWLFAAVIAAPTAEELFFRGMLFARTEAVIRIPAQALLFAAAHMQIEQGVFAFAGGLVFGWIALEFGLVAAVLCHGLTNFFSLAVVFSKEPLGPVFATVFLLAAAAGFVYVKVRK
jgi:membrane protease YdiL (CAAX protease family)